RGQAEERAQRQAGGLCGAVVREDVDRAAGRAPVREALVEPQRQHCQIERVVGHEVEGRMQVTLDGLRRLAEERVGHSLAPRNAIAFTQLDENDLLRRVCGPRDREGNGQMQLEDPDLRLHAGTAARSASPSRSNPLTVMRDASWQRTMRCGAVPCRRPSVTPEKPGCVREPWPSTITQSARSAASHTMRSAAPAMKSATTASTAMPSPAMAMPVCPVATNAARSPARSSARTISRDAVIFPTAASVPTVRTTVAPSRGRR